MGPVCRIRHIHPSYGLGSRGVGQPGHIGPFEGAIGSHFRDRMLTESSTQTCRGVLRGSAVDALKGFHDEFTSYGAR